MASIAVVDFTSSRRNLEMDINQYFLLIKAQAGVNLETVEYIEGCNF